MRLDDDLLREAKEAAARTGRTLTQVIEDALRQFLAHARRPRRREGASVPTFRGSGLRAGVDLDDTAALLEVMEGRE